MPFINLIRKLTFANRSQGSTRKARHARPRLQLERLEDRVVPTVLFVNDNWHITADVGLAGPSLGDSVTNANDAGAAPVTAIYGTTAFGTITTNAVNPGSIGSDPAFDTINDAIAAAVTVVDTVRILEGTFTENIILNKQLTLQGNQSGVDARGRVAAETILMPANTAVRTLELQTGSALSVIDGFTFSGGTRTIESTTGPLNNLQIRNNRIINFTDNGIFLNDPGTDITVDRNVIDGSSKTTAGGLVHLDTDLFNGFHLTNNNIVNGSTATGFFVDGNHNVGPSVTRTPLISGNLVSGNTTGMNLGRFAFGSLAAPVPGPYAGTIINNTFSNNAFDGLQGGVQHTLITQNTFSGNGRSGLALTGFGGATDATRGAQNSDIIQNLFSGNGLTQNGEDILFSSGQFAGTISTNKAFDNSFTSNRSLTYLGTEVIDASGNYWGTSDNPSVAGKINQTGTTHVDYTPWLNFGIEDPGSGGDPGFQGDFRSLSVDDDSPQVGLVPRIQEAIGMLTGTGAIRIFAGTYTETIDVTPTGNNKAVTFSVGDAPGQVIVNGDLRLNSDDTLIFQLNGTTAGSDYDQFVVNGTRSLGNADVRATLGFTAAIGNSFVLIDNAPGNVTTGIFAGKPEGATIALDGRLFTITYVGGVSGNDVIVTRVTTLGIGSVAADFDQDGNKDILWRQESTGRVWIWRLNGTQLQSSNAIVFVAPSPAGDDWQIAGTGDFDKDGNQDILWRQASTGDVWVWRLNGTQLAANPFVKIGTSPAGTDWQVAGTGDFDKDSNIDILWRQQSSGDVWIWRLNGTQTQTTNAFIKVGTSPAGTDWQIVGTGDFDKDGNIDVLWRQFSSGDLWIWRLNGTQLQASNSFVFITTLTGGADLQIEGTGDFDKDGNIDILKRRVSTGEVSILRLNGTQPQAVNADVFVALSPPGTDWQIG